MSIIDRFRDKGRSDSELDSRLETINRALERLEQRRQDILNGGVFMMNRSEEYEYIDELIYVLTFKQERLLERIDKRNVRLAKAALGAGENTIR